MKNRLTVRNERIDDLSLARVQGASREVVRSLQDNPFLLGRMMRVAFTAGSPKIVSHGLGAPATFIPIRIPGASFELPSNVDQGIVARARAIGTWANSAAASATTVGARWRLYNERLIVGARCIWRYDGSTHTLRLRVYRDSDGVSLRDATVVVGETGIYEARFSTPLSFPALTAFTVSAYSTTSLKYSWSNDNTWHTLAPVRTGPDLLLDSQALFSTGDVRPTSLAGAERYVIEPILSSVAGFAESSDQSGLDPKNQLRIQAASTCTADLWLFPRGPETGAV